MPYANPTKLYSSADLLADYQPDTPMGFASSWDFGVFRQYIADGAASPKSELLAAHAAVALQNMTHVVQGEPLKVSTAVLTRRMGD